MKVVINLDLEQFDPPADGETIEDAKKEIREAVLQKVNMHLTGHVFGKHLASDPRVGIK